MNDATEVKVDTAARHWRRPQFSFDPWPRRSLDVGLGYTVAGYVPRHAADLDRVSWTNGEPWFVE